MSLTLCMLLILWSGWDVNGMDLIATNWPSLTHHSHKLNFKKADGWFISGNRIMCQFSFLFHSWALVKWSLPTGFVHIVTIQSHLKSPCYSHTGFLKHHLNTFSAVFLCSTHSAEHSHSNHTGFQASLGWENKICPTAPSLSPSCLTPSALWHKGN